MRTPLLHGLFVVLAGSCAGVFGAAAYSNLIAAFEESLPDEGTDSGSAIDASIE